MNIARVIISDRGDRYLPQSQKSMDTFVDYPWSATVHIDDSNHDLGMAGAVREAWNRLPKDTDYVWHQEEDWVVVADVPVEAMCRTIEHNTHLAQLCLKRGPVTPDEITAGGFVELAREEYSERSWWPSTGGRHVWLEHKRVFSLNPCVYPYWITTNGVPNDPAGDGVERVLTDRLLDEGLVFGVWGSRGDDPQVIHIGYERSAGWKL